MISLFHHPQCHNQIETGKFSLFLYLEKFTLSKIIFLLLFLKHNSTSNAKDHSLYNIFHSASFWFRSRLLWCDIYFRFSGYLMSGHNFEFGFWNRKVGAKKRMNSGNWCTCAHIAFTVHLYTVYHISRTAWISRYLLQLMTMDNSGDQPTYIDQNRRRIQFHNFLSFWCIWDLFLNNTFPPTVQDITSSEVSDFLVTKVGARCGFSGRFEDGSFSMKTKMKICSNLHWRMKMWRTQISGLLKNEDYQLPHLLKMKIAFLKLLKTEDLKTPLKNVKKVKIMSCAGSPKLLS